ncbi:MAG: hypothetical protein ACLKAK_07355 [Alkaliphilus sp.]
MSLREKGNAFMSWTFLKTARARQEWWDYGDQFSYLHHFDFLVQDDTGAIHGTIPAADMDRVARWPNTKYLLCVRNDGITSRFRAIVENTNGAQDKFMSDLHSLLDTHPHADGWDIDLEKGPNENPDGVVALASRIWTELKARPTQNYVFWCLPPMTGDGVPFWEVWCDYSRMDPFFDSCCIMSYAFAWAGSAPGPISPMWWMEDIYDYAITRIPAGKIHLGIVGFGFLWQIYKTPTTRRGVGYTFLAFLNMMQGADPTWGHDTALQPIIPFAGFLDRDSQSPYAMFHVYDEQQGRDATTILSPAMGVSGAVGNVKREYLTTYEKNDVCTFTGTIVDRTGDSFDTVSGAMDVGTGWISPRAPALGATPPEEEGLAVYNFNIATAGTYELVVRFNAPWYTKQLLQFALNGVPLQVGPFADWYPLHRRVHWVSLGNHSMAVGANTLEVHGAGSQYGTQFWSFRVCSSFTMTMDGGGGEFTLMPRRFKAMDNTWHLPANFILTPEVLRHVPEHAWVWYDDFRDNTLAFYLQSGGMWSIDTDPLWRLLIQSDAAIGDAQIQLSYREFGDLNIRARLRMTSGNGTMGITFKAAGFNDLYLLLLRRSTQAVELWQRVAGTWSEVQPAIAQSVVLDRWYTLRVRTRGNELHCFVGTTRVFNVSIALPTAGGFGIRTSDAACECSLLDTGSPYVYVPQEAIDVTPPGGSTVTFGRIARTGVTWLEPWGYFQFMGPGEEHETRIESISLDFDYLHTPSFAAFEDDRPVTVRLRDRGVWLTKLYLGDALGFSLAHFSDAEHFRHLRNLAKHRWGLKGVAWWALGLQDPLIYRI